MARGGWRRAFCTSVRRDPEVTVATRMEVGEKQQRTPSVSPGPSPRSCAKRGFFSGSNPSTPRLALAASLRCRTKSKSSDSPNLQCDTPTSAVTPAAAAAAATAASTPRSRSPALFRRKAFSTPSSPRSPSRFALFKHLSRSRCRLCSASVGDALRKATKVLEDRRERNPVATIMLLSDSRQPQQTSDPEKKDNNNSDRHDHKPLRSPRGTCGGDIRRHALSTTTTAAATTRFAHLEIPVEDAGFVGAAEPSPMKQEDAFIKCVGGLVSVVMQDVRLQLDFPSGEISAVYPCGGGGGCGDVAIGGESSVLWLGDLYADEEREVLVELRAPVAVAGPQSGLHHLSVKCNYRDPATQELAFGAEQIPLLPLLQCDPEPGSSCRSTTALRLRNIFVATRAVAESRRLADLSDYATAHHLLSSARALLLQSASDAHGHHLVQNLDAELADLQRRRRCLTQYQLHHEEQQEEYLSPSGRTSRREGPAEVRGEPLTPTSAWRAAEQLAKVAIMRKSLSRVSDLHGFENARF
ncbi:hypothetical protein OPV22_024567 [Ensete ventricosum]|uniref:E3 ubiquitin-protein ligase WAV3-like C-terminal domain-containing protein n=1 Tax=Ensete ventricosum TaxID=4639 RepID=A0AAV8QH45_ENSVE|nr:hypothetical protein OPV22_024567 [Ensete ventricosum]